VWNDLTEKWVLDMDDPYDHNKYMETVWWLLKQIYNKDLMYKYTIQPYSPKAGTGLSSHEVNQQVTVMTDTTVVAQFKAINETLQPLQLWRYPYLGFDNDSWTLPSNTALTVGQN
jgi:isoleucyl-tRNA synthetase